MERSKTHLDTDLAFQFKDTAPLTLTLREISVNSTGTFPEILLSVTCRPEAYKAIDLHHLFGLEPENRRGDTDVRFDEGKDIEMDLGLKKHGFEVVSEVCKNADELKAALLAGNHTLLNETLGSGESWLALNVKQAMELPEHLQGKGRLKAGYYTIYAEKTKGKKQPSALSELLVGFFEKNAIRFVKEDKQDIYRIRIAYPGGSWNCSIYLFETIARILVVNMYPGTVTRERMSLITEFITRANDGLVTGNFSLNLDQGELYFKTSEHFTSGDTFNAQLSSLIQISCETFEKYQPGITSILSGDPDVVKVLEAIESR